MEDEMRRFFRLDVQRPHEGMKDTAMKALLKSDDLLFEWCLIAVEADDDISTLVLEKIVELYVTVRGFAFAKSCMEMYKQVKKKTVQKSRALRSKLACNQWFHLCLFFQYTCIIIYIQQTTCNKH